MYYTVLHVTISRQVMATYQVPLVQTNEEFLYKVMNSDKPVLLNFTAVAWCIS